MLIAVAPSIDFLTDELFKGLKFHELSALVEYTCECSFLGRLF